MKYKVQYQEGLRRTHFLFDNTLDAASKFRQLVTDAGVMLCFAANYNVDVIISWYEVKKGKETLVRQITLTSKGSA